MLIVITIILILLIAGTVCLFGWFGKTDIDDIGFVFSMVIEVLGLLASIIMLIIIGVSVSSEKALYNKIEIYKEENTKLEQQIDAAVKAYILHEEKYAEIYKNESSIVLIQVVPELKSNELVMRQFDILQANNQQIKEAREEITNLSTKKWWLYFGG